MQKNDEVCLFMSNQKYMYLITRQYQNSDKQWECDGMAWDACLGLFNVEQFATHYTSRKKAKLDMPAALEASIPALRLYPLAKYRVSIVRFELW